MVGMCGQMMTVVRGWMQAIVTATPQIILYFAKRQRQLKAWVAYYQMLSMHQEVVGEDEETKRVEVR